MQSRTFYCVTQHQLEVPAAALLLQDLSFLRLRTFDDRRGAYDMHKLVQEAAQCGLRQ